MYRQLGDSNSQWHKKICKKCQLGEVLVGESASWTKCQLGEVPVGGQKFNYEVPVGESAPWGKCQLGKVPVGDKNLIMKGYLGNCQLGEFLMQKIKVLQII